VFKCPLLGVLCALVLWFLRNVACNSHVNISNIEIVSLELQRFGVLQKVRVSELQGVFNCLCIRLLFERIDA